MNIDHLHVDALSDASDDLQILFFDTFSSPSIEDRPFDDPNKKDYSVGLIQFNEPVIIHELRIVPLSTLVTSETLKGGRLGATIPSAFDVHFYVNDLKTKDASTFLDIGSFSYKEHERFIYKPQLHVPTDGLFLRGLFESLTIAVLGVVTDISQLVCKQQSGRDQAHANNSYHNIPDEIKSIHEEEEFHNSSLDKSIEIKEPDDVDELDFSVFPTSSTTANPRTTSLPTNTFVPESSDNENCEPNHHQHHFRSHKESHHAHHSTTNIKTTITNTSSSKGHDHVVLKEDVHSLSPSPLAFGRIRSPSSQHSSSRLSLPKRTRHSPNSSRSSSKDVAILSRGREKREEVGLSYNYGKPSKYSMSPSNSLSPSPYSLKRGSSPAKYSSRDRHRLSSPGSLERDFRSERSSLAPAPSSSHHRDRDRDRDRPYYDDKYYDNKYADKYGNKSNYGEDEKLLSYQRGHRSSHRSMTNLDDHRRSPDARGVSSSAHSHSAHRLTPSNSYHYNQRSSQRELEPTQSRSPSKESLYGRTAYLRSLDGRSSKGRYGEGSSGGSGGSSRRSLSRDRAGRRPSASPLRGVYSSSSSRGRSLAVLDGPSSDRRSVGSLSRSGRNYDDLRDRRDLSSPKSTASSSKQPYHYTSSSSTSLMHLRSSSSRRSRSISPPLMASGSKRRYRDSPVPPHYDQHQNHEFHRSSMNHRDHYTALRSPEHKRTRYSITGNYRQVDSPSERSSYSRKSGSASRSHSNIRSLSPSSPLEPRRGILQPREGNSGGGYSRERLDSRVSKASSRSSSSPRHSTFGVSRRQSSGAPKSAGNCLSPSFNSSSRHSSLSNVSLKSLENNHVGKSVSNRSLNGTGETLAPRTTITPTTLTAINGNVNELLETTNGLKLKSEDELFEPLSPSDDLLDLPDVSASAAESTASTAAVNNENYDQISLSSDVDMEGEDVLMTTEVKVEEEVEEAEKEKAELLEEISSDEEYEDDLNAALPSDNIDFAKSYLEGNAAAEGDETPKYEDDEVDSAFDISKSLFDPLTLNQLKPLVFPFNSNTSTTYIDEKLFKVIVDLVEEKFSQLYSSSEADLRRDLINELWVKDVEQLAGEIMKLTSPIFKHCSNTSCEEDGDRLEDDHLDRLISIFIAITKDGLNFELAKTQKQAFKVRHLKAGIKLFTALFSSLDLEQQISGDDSRTVKLSEKLLQANLAHDLLLLYNKPYMTLSLRLLLLNGLIVLADHPEGVVYLCTEKLEWPDVDRTIEEVFGSISAEGNENIAEAVCPKLTIYQYILTLLLQPQKSRLTSIFEELLDKVHLFELFKALADVRTDDLMSDLAKEESSSVNETSTTLKAMLVQLHTSFSRLSNRIHRPLRLLPNICQYEIKTAVHTSTPLLLLGSSTSDQAGVSTTSSNPDEMTKTTSELLNFIRTRFSCRHISCSSSKMGFFSQKAFYRYLKHTDLLGHFVRILEAAGGEFATFFGPLSEEVVSLLDAITSHQAGLKFMLEDERNAEYANAIHRCLISGNCDRQIFGVKFVTRLHTLNLVDGILQNIYASQLENSNEDVEEAKFQPKNDNLKAIENLYRLYTMVYLEQAVYRDSVLTLLTMEHNFDAIIAFLLPVTLKFQKKTEGSNSNSISSLDSISFVYATKLTVSVIQYLPERHLVHFYDSYGQLLLKAIESVQSFKLVHKSDIYQSHIFKFASLGSWLSPLKLQSSSAGSSPFSHEELAIRTFVTVLKRANDACREKFATIESYIHRVFHFEAEIITAVKVLVALCDPSADYGKNQDPDIQLKYKHSLLHCYSYDTVSYLLTLLEALAETCLRPSHQAFAYSFDDSYASLYLKEVSKQQTLTSTTTSNKGQHSQQSLQAHSNSFAHQGSVNLEFIRPSVRLLKLILRYLLDSVGGAFSDSTPVPILLRVYNYLDFYQLSVANTSSKNNQKTREARCSIAREVQKEIVDILLSVYTAVFVEHSESEEALRRSVWTKMLQAVLTFISASPKNFKSGLEVLGRLLPPPFPANRKEVTDYEAVHLINYRKLWAAHLHVLKGDLESTVNLLLLSDCPVVRRRLRRLCRTLCGLHTPTVTTLARSLTEFFVHNLNRALPLAWDGEQPATAYRQTITNCSKTLDLMAYLFSVGVPFRVALLNALYLLINCDTARKEPSKIYKLLGKLFKFLHGKRLEVCVKLSSERLFKNILAEDDFESTANDERQIYRLFVEYFEKNRSLIVVTSEDGVFRFPEKPASRYIAVTSESLNDYFGRRFCATNLDAEAPANDDTPSGELQQNIPVTVKEENKDSDGSNLVHERNSEDIEIYTPEFAALSIKDDDDEGEDENKPLEEPTEFRINFAQFSRKYFASTATKDGISLSKTLEVLYSAIVEPPEPSSGERSSEGGDGHHYQSMGNRSGMHHHHHHHNQGLMMSHHHNPNHHHHHNPHHQSGMSSNSGGNNNKRLSLRGRNPRSLYGSRLDPFRSRPPNTSRPPSMHVDEFVALEQGSSLKNNSRSGGSGINSLGNSSSSAMSLYSANKHQEYMMRKKNQGASSSSSSPSSHHLSQLHGGSGHHSSGVNFLSKVNSRLLGHNSDRASNSKQ